MEEKEVEKEESTIEKVTLSDIEKNKDSELVDKVMEILLKIR